MMTFYLVGSLISVICFVIGDSCDDDNKSQNTMAMFLAAILSWFGLIGAFIFWLEERRK